jgi:indole-3-glycerol phosphate synthase
LSSILERIFSAKRAELAQARSLTPLAQVASQARSAPAALDFMAALGSHRPAIIAEIKRASPSKGDIMPSLDPVAVALDYRACGAAAISVLTDVHFKGSIEDLRAVRAAVDLPLLRKDFIFDPYQVFQARAAGADCILLIAAMLTERDLCSLAALAAELGMAALIETHNAIEMRAAGSANAQLIGINNRDLHSFVTDIALTESLLADYQGPAVMVAESGIDQPQDIRRLYRAGARAFLIGESLLRTGSPRAKLTELMRSLEESPRQRTSQ